MVKSIKFPLDGNRRELFDEAYHIVASDNYDQPPKTEVLEAALSHLVESKRNLERERKRGRIPPDHIQRLVNTSTLRFRYRTLVDSPWRDK